MFFPFKMIKVTRVHRGDQRSCPAKAGTPHFLKLREAGAVLFSPTSLEPALLTDHLTASSKFLQMAWKMSL